MNANGRRQRQANNFNRHLAKICGKAVRGGRSIYKRAFLSVSESIQRARSQAAAEARRKANKSKGK